MPNHIDTQVVVTGNGRDINQFKKLFIAKDKEGILFDFNAVIPMPEELKDTISPSPRTLIQAKEKPYDWVDEKDIERVIAVRVAQFENKAKYIKKFGADNWYDWSINHWGTKWNSYNCSVVGESKGMLRLHYNTAWSPAKPVFDKLAEMFPQLSFEMRVLDEGWGYAGTYYWSEGDFWDEIYQDEESIKEFAEEYYDYEADDCEDEDCE